MLDTFSRADGRGATDLRELTVVYERLDRVDGSARFGFGAHAVHTLYPQTDVQQGRQRPLPQSLVLLRSDQTLNCPRKRHWISISDR